MSGPLASTTPPRFVYQRRGSKWSVGSWLPSAMSALVPCLVVTGAWWLSQLDTLNNHYEGYAPKAGEQVHQESHLPDNSEDFYNDYVTPRRPVLFRLSLSGGVDTALGWRTQSWTDEELSRRVGDVEVDVETPMGKKFGREVERFHIPFRDFLEASKNRSKRYYLNLQDALGHDDRGPRLLRPPASLLSRDFSIPSFLMASPVNQINFWMGFSRMNGSASQMHSDPDDNMYVVTAGSKKLTLFSPADAERMYTYGKPRLVQRNGRTLYAQSVKRPHFSQVDAGNPDFGRFPDFRDAIPLKVTVHAGDMLFIPAGWQHETTSMGRHVALNFWMRPPHLQFDEEPPVYVLWGWIFLDVMQWLASMAR